MEGKEVLKEVSVQQARRRVVPLTWAHFSLIVPSRALLSTEGELRALEVVPIALLVLLVLAAEEIPESS